MVLISGYLNFSSFCVLFFPLHSPFNFNGVRGAVFFDDVECGLIKAKCYYIFLLSLPGVAHAGELYIVSVI